MRPWVRCSWNGAALLTRIRRSLTRPAGPRDSYVLSRAIFLRALGAIYLIAFVSLVVQVDGLIGSRGILPAADFLAAVRHDHPELGPLGRLFELPTLCWISASDGFLAFLCYGGIVLSALLILGLAPSPVLVLLWVCYLALVQVGQVFLGYQWDTLLLECGFLAIFFAPPQLFLWPAPLPWRSSFSVTRPSRIALLLLRWLLFRLMLLSGLVKLANHDPTWRSLTALTYHYWTQPLPAWTSWYANLAPGWFQAMSTAGTLFIELLAPLLIFTTRRGRLAAAGLIVFLQLLIAATGNYGFFNLLTISLCIPLIDDEMWTRLSFGRLKAPPAKSGRRLPQWLPITAAVCLVLLTLPPFFRQIGWQSVIPRPLDDAWKSVAQFDSINGYGLFASMTTRRWELSIEGSDDGSHWQAYEFKWKPGDVTRRPRFCMPHMPRLDWQMWFAGVDLCYYGQLDSWMLPFLERLHEGSPPVLRLLRSNPFPDHSPAYLRIVIYDYTFTTWRERRQTGAWWRRAYVATLGRERSSQPAASD